MTFKQDKPQTFSFLKDKLEELRGSGLFQVNTHLPDILIQNKIYGLF